MTDQVSFTIDEVLEMMRENIFRRVTEVSYSYFPPSFMGGYDLSKHFRGGAAVGFKMGNHIGVSVQEINPDLPDFWDDPKGKYAAYAAMKCITALEEEVDTSDTGEEFNFSRAVHAGAVVLYLPEYNAWVSIAFSGYKSEQDKDIAAKILKEFFTNEKEKFPSNSCGGGSDGS